jgi:hypothetical protein
MNKNNNNNTQNEHHLDHHQHQVPLAGEESELTDQDFSCRSNATIPGEILLQHQSVIPGKDNHTHHDGLLLKKSQSTYVYSFVQKESKQDNVSS